MTRTKQCTNLSILFLALVMMISASANGQEHQCKAELTQLQFIDGRLHIYYDLLSDNPLDTVYISIFFSDAGLDNRIYPRHTSGDIGAGITPGYAKHITWDIVADDISLDIPLKCNIMVDEVFGDGKTGGPGYAFASLAIPGLGDYFVADHRNMKIKPWYRTAVSLGSIGLGIWSASERRDKMRLIPGHYVTKVKWSTGEHITTWVPDRYVVSGTEYHMFSNDAEVLIGIGAAIWLADVFWVMNKGLKNQKISELTSSLDKLNAQPFLSYSMNSVQYGLRFNF